MGDQLGKSSRVCLRREHIEIIQQLALNLDLAETTRADLDSYLYRLAEPVSTGWSFMRLNQDQFRYVVRAVRDCRRPATTLSVWNVAITYMRIDTGEILALRKQLAEDAGTSLGEVSRAMSELTKIGAVLKARRGQHVVYSINPNVGWNGSEGTRQSAAKEEVPLLRLVSNRKDVK